ncbi:MAG: glycosyl hydrolase family 8 [Candidatus Brocadia sp.]|jgi:Endoglucanase Y|uniref:cellulase n=1 Tax=Candidatus Brocadia fulgida TaxID=380242 RepID=A0A0M2URP4_9BACT|nr:MAG: endoglucanase (endo-1,4-beta-D-glucanase - carboxymethylcellulase) [Candidatus Brocadia fulgida]UJS21041.1 MAG: glycosyl hydrolase family 8 [Candidatus Brocadia sp.]
MRMSGKRIIFALSMLYLFISGCSEMRISPEKQLRAWWKSYKKNFLLPDGRIQRPEHAYDTVSEGQAYAMIFSVFMDDKEAFDWIFRWTENHLGRSRKYGDHLLAWYWKDGDVSDWMPASDADGDYALALLQASRQWKEPAYREKAIEVISDIMKHEVVRGVDNRLYLLPGLWGKEKNGHLIQNPSYYNPAAFRRFYEATRDGQWLQLIETSYWLFHQASVRLDTIPGSGFIPDWCVVDAQGNIGKAEGRSTDYGWEAVRIPMRIGLDMLWYHPEEASKILGRILQLLQSSIPQNGGIKAVYQYTGEPTVEYGSLAADAMSYFLAQLMAAESDTIRASFKNRLTDESFMQNYYGQSMSFYPLALERGILKKP